MWMQHKKQDYRISTTVLLNLLIWLVRRCWSRQLWHLICLDICSSNMHTLRESNSNSADLVNYSLKELFYATFMEGKFSGFFFQSKKRGWRGNEGILTLRLPSGSLVSFNFLHVFLHGVLKWTNALVPSDTSTSWTKMNEHFFHVSKRCDVCFCFFSSSNILMIFFWCVTIQTLHKSQYEAYYSGKWLPLNTWWFLTLVPK